MADEALLFTVLFYLLSHAFILLEIFESTLKAIWSEQFTKTKDPLFCFLWRLVPNWPRCENSCHFGFIISTTSTQKLIFCPRFDVIVLILRYFPCNGVEKRYMGKNIFPISCLKSLIRRAELCQNKKNLINENNSC